MSDQAHTLTASGPSSGTITGQVATPDGWPVPDAIITITDLAGRQVARVIVNSDASFTATGLLPGVYTVIAAAAGHQPAARTATVARDPTDIGTFALAHTGTLALPAPGVWAIDPVHSSIQATAVHLGLGQLHGRFTDFSGQIVVADPFVDTFVEVNITAASLDTHHPDRDAHLRSVDFLDVDRFPTITYKSDKVERTGAGTWTVTGPLTLLDVTRPVRLDVTYRGTGPDPWGGTRAGFTATAQLARDDFAITWNQAIAAGITAFGRTLKVHIDIEAVKQ